MTDWLVNCMIVVRLIILMLMLQFFSSSHVPLLSPSSYLFYLYFFFILSPTPHIPLFSFFPIVHFLLIYPPSFIMLPSPSFLPSLNSKIFPYISTFFSSPFYVSNPFHFPLLPLTPHSHSHLKTQLSSLTFLTFPLLPSPCFPFILTSPPPFYSPLPCTPSLLFSIFHSFLHSSLLPAFPRDPARLRGDFDANPLK